MKLSRGRWSVVSVAVAIAITAVALVLHHFTPGNAEWRSAYEARGDGGAEAATVSVSDARLVAALSASFEEIECAEDGVFLLLTATYLYTDLGGLPRRGMTADGARYLPAACQDDGAGTAPVAGQHATVDTVFVVDSETWESIRGGEVSFQVAQFDPWYESFGSRAVVDVAVPEELQDTIAAEAPR